MTIPMGTVLRSRRVLPSELHNQHNAIALKTLSPRSTRWSAPERAGGARRV